MDAKEGTQLEYKRDFTPHVKKTLVAFANSEGGEVWFGVADDGEAVGVDDPDSLIQQVYNSIRDAIKPDLTLFTDITIEMHSGKALVKAVIQRGTDQPYYLAEKGLRPAGVYVRQGSTSVPASQEAIRQMIKLTDGDIYEEMRSLDQELTFDYLEAVFLKRGLECGVAQKQTLGIIGSDGLYTNLALLMSEQCRHSIKAAYFEGISKAVFKDRRELSGSLLKQLDDCYAYLDLFNRTRSTIEGLYRIDEQDYPPEALREALINAIIHRDYSTSGSILVSIFEHGVEINNLGGLVPGVTMDSILLGISQSRNARLANIFYRLRLIETYGTGIRKIFSLYETYDEKPVLKAVDSAFQIKLPNVHYKNETYTRDTITVDTVREIPEQYHVLLQYAAEQTRFQRKDIEQLLHVGQTRAIQILKDLTNRRLLEKKTAGKNTWYEPSK